MQRHRRHIWIALSALALTSARTEPAAAQLAFDTGGNPLRGGSTPFVPRAAEPELPLAVDGFCVVSLHDRQEWVRGNPQFGAMFDGRQYLFADQRERDIFVAAPTVYAPVLNGDCVVTFVESGQRVPGRVQFGTLNAGRTYFFADDARRAKFIAAPAQFAEADIADRGRCLVSSVDQGRDVAGLPETAVLVGGMRRLFAGAHQQQLFLQQPERYDAASTVPGLAAKPGPNGGGWRRATQRSSDDTATPEDAEPDASAEDREFELQSEPAMGGYCPVTIREKGVWQRGRYEDRAIIDNLNFFTAGPAEHERFLADPTKYIPALGGLCAVTRVDLGEDARGSIYYAAEYQGRLYLFVDAERKAAFKNDPARYALADVAAEGACVVTLAEDERREPGLPEHSAWFRGRLYRFAGPDQRAKFLATPEKYAVREQRPGAEE